MARHGNWSLILELEGVQRSFTRMIDGLGLMTYRERLYKLNLTTLLERRVRGDLIEMFKIQEGFVGYGSDLFGRSGRTVALLLDQRLIDSPQMRLISLPKEYYATGIACLRLLKLVNQSQALKVD